LLIRGFNGEDVDQRDKFAVREIVVVGRTMWFAMCVADPAIYSEWSFREPRRQDRNKSWPR
jgi:hypothetical protein